MASNAQLMAQLRALMAAQGGGVEWSASAMPGVGARISTQLDYPTLVCAVAGFCTAACNGVGGMVNPYTKWPEVAVLLGLDPLKGGRYQATYIEAASIPPQLASIFWDVLKVMLSTLASSVLKWILERVLGMTASAMLEASASMAPGSTTVPGASAWGGYGAAGVGSAPTNANQPTGSGGPGTASMGGGRAQ